MGAGSVVTKNVEEYDCVVGNPAKKICKVNDIKNKETGESIYPWANHFDRGMPWEGMEYDDWIRDYK